MTNRISLSKLKESVKNYPGVTRKKSITDIYSNLVSTHLLNQQFPSYGDDAAIIQYRDEYLLLAADGIMPSLIANEPYRAGKAAVMVCVNDIYAMGGKAIGDG